MITRCIVATQPVHTACSRRLFTPQLHVVGLAAPGGVTEIGFRGTVVEPDAAAEGKWTFGGVSLDNVIADANADQCLPDVEIFGLGVPDSVRVHRGFQERATHPFPATHPRPFLSHSLRSSVHTFCSHLCPQESYTVLRPAIRAWLREQKVAPPAAVRCEV